ncbi:putative colanic acid biosynthesis acetyltransferase [Mycolicibacterium rufum]|uniref:Colanic acid biosynthesis acetyltransferase n=1 Tax=Mycolicibacterium rufum TaxID=318424 RepID=A0A9X2YGQ6_9MYCO|nr:DapH/DapD/GlmU-related protein [Mycolicibacterium rufum]MCV7073458.1 putative colanic acid biosynthesis acetyltransferase [Mycolicibacterium rufum]ULP38230.1 putative colanic acid biosynthesis acetyltransferase [Mycolicibacterium rufum]
MVTHAFGNGAVANRFDLSGFTGEGYDKGRSIPVQILWLAVSRLIVRKWWCPNALRIALLRAFGATIGAGTIIRSDVKIHWPWKLTLGSHCWIGEEAWILNLEPVTIGANTCISQAALLCTGSHARRSATFEFDNGPIVVGNSVWVGARATILRGVDIGDGATLGATALVPHDVKSGEVVLAPKGVSQP